MSSSANAAPIKNAAVDAHQNRASARGARNARPVARSIAMLDLIMLALGLAFFALSVGYTVACDRL
jgi:hypothetical protein